MSLWAFQKTRNHPFEPTSWRSHEPQQPSRVSSPRPVLTFFLGTVPIPQAPHLSLSLSPGSLFLWAADRTLICLNKVPVLKGVGMGRVEGKFVRLMAGATHNTELRAGGAGEGGKRASFDPVVAPWERSPHPGRNKGQLSLTHLVGSKRRVFSSSLLPLPPWGVFTSSTQTQYQLVLFGLFL